jgi:hypothetical protein
MRLTQQGVLLFLIIGLSCELLSAQTQKLTPPESDLADQASAPVELHPLHDYVPCTFSPKDRQTFHALFNKSGNSAVNVLRQAMSEIA